jgi:putative ATP-binding cassette transporter
VLWSIRPALLLAGVLYAAGGSLLTLLLGRRLVDLDAAQLKKEADLIHDLIHAGAKAESDGPAVARRKGLVRARLDAVVENFTRIIRVNRNLGFFTTGYNYLIPVLPVLIVAPLYFREQILFGEVTQSAMAFAHVLGAFSVIVVEFQRISSFAAVVTRLGSLWEALAGPDAPEPPPAEAPAIPPERHAASCRS